MYLKPDGLGENESHHSRDGETGRASPISGSTPSPMSPTTSDPEESNPFHNGKIGKWCRLVGFEEPYHSDVLITVLFALTENDWPAVAVVASEIVSIILTFGERSILFSPRQHCWHNCRATILRRKP